MKHDLRVWGGAYVRASRFSIFICCLTLLLVACTPALVAQNLDMRATTLREARSYYFSGDMQRAEVLVKKLIGTNNDLDGSATVQLAEIYYQNDQDEQALDLLRHHEALAALYKEVPPENRDASGSEWSDEKRALYSRLKYLHGGLRFRLGQKDKSVLRDILDGISSYYSIRNPDYLPSAETLQFAAFIFFSEGSYEKAIFYWNEFLAGLLRVDSVARRKGSNTLEDNKDVYHETEYNIACAYAKLGNVDQTLSWLRKSLVHKPKERLQFILTDHDLDNVREDLRFKDFIRGLQKG